MRRPIGALTNSQMCKSENLTRPVVRRWRILRKVIDDGHLGRVWRIESRMDQDSPQTIEPGPSGGLLRDLGSQVVDQMVYLLGPVQTVDAQMDTADLSEGPTDVSFTITLRHTSGAHSHVSACKRSFIDARELCALGDLGSYVSKTIDIQAQDIFAGKRPVDDLAGWGYEPKENWGILATKNGRKVIPSEQGRYHDYYEAFAEAVKTGGEPPVTAKVGARTLAVLDAARQSALEGRSVTLKGL